MSSASSNGAFTPSQCPQLLGAAQGYLISRPQAKLHFPDGKGLYPGPRAALKQCLRQHLPRALIVSNGKIDAEQSRQMPEAKGTKP